MQLWKSPNTLTNTANANNKHSRQVLSRWKRFAISAIFANLFRENRKSVPNRANHPFSTPQSSGLFFFPGEMSTLNYMQVFLPFLHMYLFSNTIWHCLTCFKIYINDMVNIFCKLPFHSLLVFWDFINMVRLHTWPLYFFKVNVDLEVGFLDHRLFMALILLALVLLFSEVLVPTYIHTSYSSTWLRIYALRFINFSPSDERKVVAHWSLVCITLVYLRRRASRLSSSVTCLIVCAIYLFFLLLYYSFCYGFCWLLYTPQILC